LSFREYVRLLKKAMSYRSVAQNRCQIPKYQSKTLQIWGLRPLNGGQITTIREFFNTLTP
jgi:hypothetical protein